MALQFYKSLFYDADTPVLDTAQYFSSLACSFGRDQQSRHHEVYLVCLLMLTVLAKNKREIHKVGQVSNRRNRVGTEAEHCDFVNEIGERALSTLSLWLHRLATECSRQRLENSHVIVFIVDHAVSERLHFVIIADADPHVVQAHLVSS